MGERFFYNFLALPTSVKRTDAKDPWTCYSLSPSIRPCNFSCSFLSILRYYSLPFLYFFSLTDFRRKNGCKWSPVPVTVHSHLLFLEIFSYSFPPTLRYYTLRFVFHQYQKWFFHYKFSNFQSDESSNRDTGMEDFQFIESGLDISLSEHSKLWPMTGAGA